MTRFWTEASGEAHDVLSMPRRRLVESRVAGFEDAVFGIGGYLGGSEEAFDCEDLVFMISAAFVGAFAVDDRRWGAPEGSGVGQEEEEEEQRGEEFWGVHFCEGGWSLGMVGWRRRGEKMRIFDGVVG